MDPEDDGPAFDDAPPVVLWFKIYAAAFGFLQLTVGAFLWFIYFSIPEFPDPAPQSGEINFPINEVIGVGIGLFCLASFLGCLIPLVVRPRPWVWTYGIVLIAFGLSGPLCLPFGIPLLIYWVKPETKRWYEGRRA